MLVGSPLYFCGFFGLKKPLADMINTIYVYSGNLLMPSLPSAQQVQSLVTSGSLQQAVGSMIPLGQISSVVQTLQNIQGFNPGQFAQLTGTIKSALQGFDTASNILSNFSGNSPVGSFLNTLQSTGLSGASISAAASAAGNAYRSADSFLGTAATLSSYARLSSQRPGVEQTRQQNNTVGGALKFPRDVGKYWIGLSFVKANVTSIMGSSSTTPIKKKSTANIVLPVPTNLVDQNTLQYTEVQMTNEAIAGLDAAGQAIAKSGRLGKFIGNLAGNLQEATQAATTAGALVGSTINTHQVLKFTQPSLKRHAFQWKLIPSSAEEANDIYKIINTIKANIYPRENGVVFDYPNLVEVFMFNANRMYMFKPAYVEAFSVTYNPDGQAFHRDGYPVAVLIDMTIHENAVWTSRDFGGSAFGSDPSNIGDGLSALKQFASNIFGGN